MFPSRRYGICDQYNAVSMSDKSNLKYSKHDALEYVRFDDLNIRLGNSLYQTRELAISDSGTSGCGDLVVED